MTLEIPINRIGKILSGDDMGQFVRLLDDSENTGGYLILLSKIGGFEDSDDDRVENNVVLKSYFAESKWLIEWQ